MENNIMYSKPVVNEDGTIMIEQVTMLGGDTMPNGIKRRELKVIQELYPNMELLRETLERAQANYDNPELQKTKAPVVLQQEKKALEGLLYMVNKI